jgi:hypothetical protein
MQRAYLFLTYALGATKVAKLTTLDGASKLFALTTATATAATATTWDLVYVEAKDKERAEKMWEGTLGVRVVDDEWVVQSLILGKLIGGE